MKSILLTSIGLILASPAIAATGSATFDFEFTSFKGSFAWSEGNEASASDPSTYLGVGTVNGVTPVYNGSHVDRDAAGTQWIIGGTAPLSGTTATMVASTFPGIPNIVSFTPVANSGVVSSGQPFELGTLSFTNGAWFGGVGNLPVELGFEMTTHSTTSAFDNQVWKASLDMVTNVDSSGGSCSSSTVQANSADFISVSGASFMGSLRVFEPFCSPNPSQTQVGAAEVWASFGSLDPNSFRNPQGDGFLSASTDIGPLPKGVPEPSTWAMMIVGLAGLASLRLTASRRAWRA